MAKPFDTSLLYSTGIINKGEELINCFPGQFIPLQKNSKYSPYVMFVITQRRLILVETIGFLKKGLSVFQSWMLNDIGSVSKIGIVFPKVQLSIKIGNEFLRCNLSFPSMYTDAFMRSLLEAKNKAMDEKIIEAKQVIVTEGKKDKAMEILQKRLARGEITLEEFHQLVQRL
ncbi:Short C-terminal domain-containing protein [Thermoplasmatales archaeon SCGC AB-540-F20]|nr:Short C-terminal domain-containing protein [Thermoplasmatales archaeon SCGC AB-540-F20]